MNKSNGCFLFLETKLWPQVYFLIGCAILFLQSTSVSAQTIEFNSTGGTTATNGLHFYIHNTSKIQVKRLNNTGQVYSPTVTPPNNSLDNGVFLRANGTVYGPSHTVSAFAPTAYSTTSITATSPVNPSTSGVQQSVTNNLGVTAGPQISIVWKYTTPLDFLTAEVTLTIPAGYAVSAANPVRYYHVFDTYLGGSDSGCGVNVVGPPRIVGTYSAVAGACPSSTTLPASGVVESFRERTGTFSRYCAALWSSFFTNGGVNCSVLQAAQMSNTIATTLQDTGIGVEYDFTATGVYTFSYDFVIGSTVVPTYDHIEIRHDGAATLCPENMTVLACTSSTVPCPALSIVNTGTTTGSVSLVGAAGVTFTPSSFSIGSSGSTANIVMQATAATAGTYALSATGVSPAPLNGTKCANLAGTASSSCNMVVTNTSCVANFDCLETGTTYNFPITAVNRNPLYTKLVSTGFNFDVVAIDSAGAIATGYTGGVDVELYDNTGAPVCTAATAIVGATQALAFLAADNGRKALAANVTLPNAYKNLKCRVKESSGGSPVTGCSSDAFTVRPQTITSVTSAGSADADNGGASAVATPKIKAGNSFSLTAQTGIVNYDGTPKVDTTLLEWLSVPVGGRAAPGTGTLAGVFNAAAAGTGTATAATFTYDEVGYFRFKVLGVYDDTFTTPSADNTNSDCTNDFSNVLVGGKYGCKFGTAAVTNYFGRFTPDHFTLTAPVITNGCPVDVFNYMDQPFAVTTSLQARSLGETVTQNYSAAAFGKGAVSRELENANSGTPIDPNRLVVTPATWSGGAYPFAGTSFTRVVPADGPYDSLAIGVLVTDTDGPLLTDRDMQASTVACTADGAGLSNGNCTAKMITGAAVKMRQGRFRLDNAYGSERLSLPLPIKIEYWGGTATSWIPNTLDTACSVVSPSNFSWSFPAGTVPKPNNLAGCESAISTAPLKLSAPGVGNNGFADITLNLNVASGNQCSAVGALGPLAVTMNKPWLQFLWNGAAYSDPKARVNFGMYKKDTKFTYIREVH